MARPQLEGFSIRQENTHATDLLMHTIKISSCFTGSREETAINNNSFGRVNKTFCRFVMNLLSVQLVFDNRYPFAAQVAPSPYAKTTDSSECTW
jgi:hypothetical protein